MKYIIIRNEDGQDFPVFCLAPKTHLDLATAWRATSAGGECRVVSAGFCEFLPEGVRTFGRSSSLDLGPRPVDARLIAAFYKATVSMGTSTEALIAAKGVARL